MTEDHSILHAYKSKWREEEPQQLTTCYLESWQCYLLLWSYESIAITVGLN